MASGRAISREARAVVTGAGSGIGRGFAEEIHRRGGAVVCADVDGEAAEETAAAIRARDGRARAVRCDVARLADVETLAKEAEAFFGAETNLVVNNAGVGVGGALVEEIPMEDWHWIVGVNFWGVVHGCRVFAPGLRRSGAGGIVNVASAASFGAAPRMGAYNATKAAVLSLSETLHAEMSGSGVHVAVLCPTFVRTNIIRGSRIAETARARAQALMDRRGVDVREVAQETLDALDRNRLHVLPQADARLSWRLKRLAPGLFTRGMGRAARAIGKELEEG
ncbi:MAG: SDR family NAD(P)-dependent oxidoreductase [Myxococcales bacterium]|nr:SDR family NAD(P)-dependent oxidoreductase [Myxococcales bacterium]